MSSINQLLGTATEPKPNETCMPAQLVGLKLHYDSRGLWRAFSAVQKLLEFLDSFLQIKFATNPFDEITDTYSELTEWLRKFQLRLVVYSIKVSSNLALRARVVHNVDAIFLSSGICCLQEHTQAKDEEGLFRQYQISCGD